MQFVQTLTHEGIKVDKKTGDIYVPLHTNMDMSCMIQDKGQRVTSIGSHEYMLYMVDGLLNSVFVGDAFLQHEYKSQVKTKKVSNFVINKIVPMFFEGIFVKPYGNGNTVAKKYENLSKENVPTFNNVKIDHTDEDTKAYGCSHLSSTHVRVDDKHVVLRKGIPFYQSFQFGNNENVAVFFNTHCFVEYKNNTLYLYSNDIDVYVFTTPNVLSTVNAFSFNVLKKALGYVLNTISLFKGSNPNYLEVFDGGKLISSEEEKIILSGDKEKILTLFKAFINRYSCEFYNTWSTMFAITDGVEDTNGSLDVISNMMMNYRRCLSNYRFHEQVVESFDTLTDVTIMSSGFYYGYLLHPSKRVFRYDIQWEKKHAETSHHEFDIVWKKKTLLFVNKNQNRETKSINETMFIQRCTYDGDESNHCFVVISRNKLNKEQLHIIYSS